MAANGPKCWSEIDIRRNCDHYSGATCDDCGVEFCQLSPMRPSTVRIDNRDYTLCALCQKPYSVHRVHWAWNTYYARQKRLEAEQSALARREFRELYEAGFSRMKGDDIVPF